MTDRELVNWLRGDMAELKSNVGHALDALARLEAREHATPCHALQSHLDNTDRATERWWTVLVRVAASLVISGIGALATVLALAKTGNLIPGK